MKKLTYFIILWVASQNLIKAQSTINGSSTNPQNPQNTDFLPWAKQHLGGGITWNPFLNTFNWTPLGIGNTKTDYIPIPFNTGWNIAGLSFSGNIWPMKNPFNTGLDAGLSKHAYYLYNQTIGKDNNGNDINANIDVEDRDFKWEDGWELLWMNLGTTPDGERIDAPHANGPFMTPQLPNPDQTPYFVLYNRYKGTMRLFANVWFNNTVSGRFQKIIPTLQFQPGDENGLLRHTSSYDLALDQPTIIKNITGPSSQPTANDKWLMSDYQIGFDPCICKRNNAKLQFKFETIDIMNIDMVSRSITVNQGINNNSYLEDDFLNLNDVSLPSYKKGSRIYNKMGNMLDAYKDAQLKYESDLANYNSLDGVLKRAAIDILKQGITSTGSMVGAGVAGSFFTNAPMKDFILKNKTRVGLFSGGLIDLDNQDAEAFAKSVTSGTKSILSQGFDFLSTTFDVPGQPIKPSPPSAAYTEASYSGTITSSNTYLTNALLVPGALPKGYPDVNGEPSDPGIDKLNYPAYNEVLGLFALLETPKIQVKKAMINPSLIFTKGVLNKFHLDPFSFPTSYNFNYKSDDKILHANYQIKFQDQISYRFNHAINFNFDKTKLYYSLRIKLKNKLLELPKLVPAFSWTWDYPTYKFSNQSIVEKESYNTESYGNFVNQDLYVVINTPFSEIKSILNEPISFTHEQLLKSSIIFNNLALALPVSNNPPSNLGDTIDYFNFYPPQITFPLTDYSQIESIELKLMADMYFLSPGSKGQEINTLQTFTYKIYENSGNDNQKPSETNSTIGKVTFLKQNESILKHQSGNVVFNNIQISPTTITAYTHHLVNATEMHIYVENAILKNNITVAPGYTAYIHFLGSAVSNPESTWEPELVLDNMKSVDLYNNPLIYEATDDELKDFCKLENNKYQANTSLSKTNNEPIIKPSKVIEKPVIQFNIYPNPANDIATVLYQLNGAMAESICIYNLAGALIQKITLTDNNNNQIILNTLDLAAGVYFVTLNANNNYSETKKLIIAK
ncbi:MAG: T9SS type A sorting domain-containing protein [Bacteroidia bacterium]